MVEEELEELEEELEVLETEADLNFFTTGGGVAGVSGADATGSTG